MYTYSYTHNRERMNFLDSMTKREITVSLLPHVQRAKEIIGPVVNKATTTV